jgi:hypothetical protein
LLNQQGCRRSDRSQDRRRGVRESLPPTDARAAHTRPPDPGEVRGVGCHEHGCCPWRVGRDQHRSPYS